MLPDPAGVPDPEPRALPPPPRGSLRARAVLEVVLCSGYLTQLSIVAVLGTLGVRATTPDGLLAPNYAIVVSAVDTGVLLGLIFWLMKQDGDSPRALFLNQRPVAGELSLGIATVPLVFTLVVAAQLSIDVLAPCLRNVPQNPFESMLESPLLLAAFVVVAVVAGGIREELQRAFLLSRFERHLGGIWVGLLITSLAFGLGHTLQGWDAALLTGLLGAVWGALYILRRSVVSTVTSHALFNVAQVVVGYVNTVGLR